MIPERTPLVTVLPCKDDSAAAKECWNALADADNDWDALSVDEQEALIDAFARHAANGRLAALEAAAKYHDAIADEAQASWDRAAKNGTEFSNRGNRVAAEHRKHATAIRSLSQPVEGSAGASVVPGYSAEPEPEVSALSGEYLSRGWVRIPVPTLADLSAIGEIAEGGMLSELGWAEVGRQVWRHITTDAEISDWSGAVRGKFHSARPTPKDPHPCK